MRRAVKQTTDVTAYCLGSRNAEIDRLISEGKLKQIDDDTFEVFSQEAVNGKGEVAHAGDYIKIDNAGFPYPNAKQWFEERHVAVGENLYRQIPSEVQFWQADEPMPEEVLFLVNSGRLTLNEADSEHYYNAELWGSPLSSPRTSYLVLFAVYRNEAGELENVEFNFVVADYFEQFYTILES